MSIKIHIPTPLRPYVDGQDEITIQRSGSVGEILSELNPALKKRIYDDKNQLRKFVNVYLNDEDIRYQQGEATPTKTGDVISIVPSIAGGK